MSTLLRDSALAGWFANVLDNCSVAIFTDVWNKFTYKSSPDLLGYFDNKSKNCGRFFLGNSLF